MKANFDLEKEITKILEEYCCAKLTYQSKQIIALLKEAGIITETKPEEEIVETLVPMMRSERECTNCHKDKLIESDGVCNCCGGKQ